MHTGTLKRIDTTYLQRNAGSLTDYDTCVPVSLTSTSTTSASATDK
jgi:hypothetical protein